MGLQILRSPVRLRSYPSILVGVVGNISACHADARGSIPRLGVFFLFFLLIFAKKKQKRTPSRGIEPRASAWQAEMLPTTPTRIHIKDNFLNFTSFIKKNFLHKKEKVSKFFVYYEATTASQSTAIWEPCRTFFEASQRRTSMQKKLR